VSIFILKVKKRIKKGKTSIEISKEISDIILKKGFPVNLSHDVLMLFKQV